MAALLSDHNFSRPLVLLLRGRGHDVVTSRELGLDRASDGEHLLRAAILGRVLLSYNERDFVLLHDAWLRWSTAWGVQPRHAGVLILPQRQDWSANRSAAEIESVLTQQTGSAANAGLIDQLWLWRPARGWFRAVYRPR